MWLHHLHSPCTVYKKGVNTKLINSKRHWTPSVIILSKPVSSLGVSQLMHKITSLRENKCKLKRRCEIIMEETTPLSHEDVFFQMLDFGTSKSNSDVSKSNSLKITQEDSVATEGAVSHNVLLLPSRLIYILVTHSVIFFFIFLL